MAEKGGYKHFMLKEIMEQPERLGVRVRLKSHPALDAVRVIVLEQEPVAFHVFAAVPQPGKIWLLDVLDPQFFEGEEDVEHRG